MTGSRGASYPRPGTGEINLSWSLEVLGALAALGLEEVVITPGSRSAPLVLAACSLPGIGARVHLDERSAGFFALGYGRRTRRAAAVVTTSGTAVANLLPAVVEADISDIPLILLTADRPPGLRGADANQTIDQVGIYGSRVRFQADLPLPSREGLREGVGVVEEAARLAAGPPGGPVHLNVPFEKPLQPETREAMGSLGAVAVQKFQRGEDPGARAAVLPPPSQGATSDAVQGISPEPIRTAARHSARKPFPEAEMVAHHIAAARRPVLVAGPSSDPDAEGAVLARFAADLAIPILADPLSGVRFAAVPNAPVVGAYDHFLRIPGLSRRLTPDLVLRTGRTPTSATLEAALGGWRDAVQIVMDAGSRQKDYQGLADHYVRAPAGRLVEELAGAGAPGAGTSAAPAWCHAWMEVEAAAWSAVKEETGDPGNEGAYAQALLDSLPPGSTLFVSSSMPVRDLDAYGRPAPKGVRVLGNRGASGIDGVVSSVLGCAAGGSGPVVGLVGDLAFYHDMNGLLASRDGSLNVVLVLVDNDGGGIFHMLPIRAFEPVFTPYFATPHGLDFRHAARLYGLPFADAETPAELAERVSAAIVRPGTDIIRVRTDRETNRRRHEAVRARVARRLNPFLTGETP